MTDDKVNMNERNIVIFLFFSFSSLSIYIEHKNTINSFVQIYLHFVTRSLYQ